ncbi:MAG: protein-ribulosamine 3-kinase, partial [Myxococcota bacterium]
PRLGDMLRVDDEVPALLHGDLWTGNAAALNGVSEEPVIYDPAVSFGCREADLAMTELFGSFGQRFFSAYAESFPIASGYSQRRDLYNLYHVLNHANLFGGGYVGQAESIARNYI